MSEFHRRRPIERETAPTRGDGPAQSQTDPLFSEEPTTVREDEEEVYDLGFIVEDHDDHRADLLSPWQRLESLDTDEALETNPTGPLPEDAQALRREGVSESWHPIDVYVESRDAESDEVEFADTNRLVVDPDERMPTAAGGEGDGAADLDRDQVPEVVDIRGHAPGIATGFGSSVPQDIGPEGFSIDENPLIVPVEELEYPISTEELSDEARGLRDVDEMGAEAELDRLADLAARLEEKQARGGTAAT
jgi:hypothetical protein